MIRRIPTSACTPLLHQQQQQRRIWVAAVVPTFDRQQQQQLSSSTQKNFHHHYHSYCRATLSYRSSSGSDFNSSSNRNRGTMTLLPKRTLYQHPIQHRHMIMFSSTNTTIEEDDDDDEYDEPPLPPITAANTKYAVVHHDAIYQKMMKGLHGQQLAAAQLEGEGKDEPDFDPFLEEELEEARLIYEQEQEEKLKKNSSLTVSTKPNNTETTATTTTTATATATTETSQTEGSNVDEKLDSTSIKGDSKRIEEEEDEIDPSSPQYQYKLFRQKYNNDGSLKRNKSELAILRAGSPAGGRLAILALGGTQYKVTTDDVLIVNLLKPTQKYAVGTIHTLSNEHILLVSSSALTLVGMPYVPDAEVDVLVEEITKDTKVIVYKKRRRKNYQRKTGFRRSVTMLRILDIRFPETYDQHDHTIRPDPAPIIPTKGFDNKIM